MGPTERLEGGAGRPRYQVLAETLSERIEAGDFAPGSALPAERQLAEEFGVSRVTVRSAIKQLAEGGWVDQRHGSGTYVTARVSQPLSTLTSFSEDVAARGLSAEQQLVASGSGRASPEEVIALGLAPGAPVTRITRLRSADGQPLAIEASTVIEQALPTPDLIDGSLYATMAANGLRPVRAVQRLTAIPIEARQAQRLDVTPGAPGLLITRVGFAADGRAVEFTRSTFRGDRWDFVAELT
ncbi:MAG: GntR family transcriptional regulator [Pseudomonadota bacterium]